MASLSYWWSQWKSKFVRSQSRSTRGPARRPGLRLEALEDRTLLSASLVADLNLTTASSAPAQLTDVNNLLYFSATDNAGDVALYKSDGTASNTVQVKEFGLARFPTGTGLFGLTNVNGTLFFGVEDRSGRAELWESNGTAAGTQLVHDFQGESIVNPSGPAGGSTFINFQNNLYFLVGPPSSAETQLWRSDGTTTTQLDAGAFGVSDLFPELTTFNGALFFSASDQTNGDKLWKTDGTNAGTRIADPDVAATNAFGLTNVNGVLYFFAVADPTNQTFNLYRSDGSGTNTTLVQAGFANVDSPETAVVNNQLYFSAAASAAPFDQELWVSDGVTTRELHPAHARSFGLNPFNLTSVNGLLVFNGFDESGGVSVWVSDGSDGGTNVLLPEAATLAQLFPGNVAAANNTLYFGAQNTGSEQQQLWQTNGTTAGTSLIADFGMVPFTGGSPSGLTFSNGTLFFDATDLTHGAELWKSNGTTAGTKLVKDINTNTVGSFPSDLVNANGELFFTADDGLSPGNTATGFNQEIWKSAGGAGGAQLVGTPFPNGGPSSFGDFPAELVSVNGMVFFTAGNDPQLWVTDGAPGAALLLKDFSDPNGFVSPPDNLTAVGNDLFFTVITGSGDEQLWRSDGTPSGTGLVADNVSVEAGSGVAVNGLYFFLSFDLNTGNTQLWRSDGSAAGTHVADPSHPGTNVSGLNNINSTLFYFDSDATNGFTVWKSDGTTNTLLADVNPGPDFSFGYNPIAVANSLYFAAIDDATGSTELWKSDGTTGGTVPVAAVKPDFGNEAAVGNRLFFTVKDPVAGEQLWVSDGTASGTQTVAAIVAGADALGNAMPFDLTSFDGKLFFTASDPTHGEELWESDGTAASTMMVQDINPGAAGSDPSQLTVVNGTLFFTADDGSHGTELWQFNPATHFQVTTSSGLAAPGAPFTVTVAALDQYGNLDTSYTGTVHFSCSDGAAALPADFTFRSADQGVHTFTVTLQTPGAQTVTAADTATSSIQGVAALTVPMDVSNRVFSFPSRPRRDCATGQFVGVAVLLLPRDAALIGPIEVVLTGLLPGVTLTGAGLLGESSVTPLTVGTTASGDPYITLDAAVLNKRLPVLLFLTFNNPAGVRIDYHINTFAGGVGPDGDEGEKTKLGSRRSSGLNF